MSKSHVSSQVCADTHLSADKHCKASKPFVNCGKGHWTWFIKAEQVEISKQEYYILNRVTFLTLLLSHLDQDLDRCSGLSSFHTSQLPGTVFDRNSEWVQEKYCISLWEILEERKRNTRLDHDLDRCSGLSPPHTPQLPGDSSIQMPPTDEPSLIIGRLDKSIC